MPRLSLVLLAAMLGLAAPSLQAQSAATESTATADGFVQRGTHAHGKVVVNLALEGGTLSAELDAPAINVVGFERAPRSDAERREVAAVDRRLAAGVGMLGVPAAARCERARVDYTPPRPGSDASANEHDHEHEHGHEADGDEHSDYLARFSYRCANPAALAWVDLWLLRRLKNVAEIEVNLVTPQLQTQRTLPGAAAARIELR